MRMPCAEQVSERIVLSKSGSKHWQLTKQIRNRRPYVFTTRLLTLRFHGARRGPVTFIVPFSSNRVSKEAK